MTSLAFNFIIIFIINLYKVFYRFLHYRKVLQQTLTWGQDGAVRCHTATLSLFCYIFEYLLAFKAFVSLFKVHFYSQWGTKWIKSYSSLRTKTWTLKARAGISAGFTPLKCVGLCVPLKAKKSSVCDGGPSRWWSCSAPLSQQPLQASVSEHRHGRPAPPQHAPLMSLTRSRDVINLQGAPSEADVRYASSCLLLLTSADSSVWSQSNVPLKLRYRSDLTALYAHVFFIRIP